MEKNEKKFAGFRMSGFSMLAVMLLLFVGGVWLLTQAMPVWGGLCLLLFVLCLPGFMMIEPNEARVMLFFGVYKGTLNDNGFWWVNPFYAKKKMTYRARNLFVFESGSRAQVVIENRSASDETYFDCQVREVFAAEDARADIVELFRLNGRSSIVSGSFTEQQASSRVHTLSVGLEGRLIRGDQHVALKGRGAENHTDGLMLSGAGQHIDFTTDIQHISRDCTSYEVFKGIASDGGTGVFSGRIYVAQDAQKTQAYQQSNNLLLGDGAHIYAKPQLEIYADDVKCSHGATVGQLSEEAVYYMRQRGIPEQTARRLQMAGFINQVVERTPVEGLTERIERLAADKIERM